MNIYIKDKDNNYVKLIPVSQVAKTLKISKGTLYSYFSRDQTPFNKIKVGNLAYIKETEFNVAKAYRKIQDRDDKTIQDS